MPGTASVTAVSVTLNRIVTKPNGNVEVYWGDGSCQYYNSWEDIAQAGMDLENPDVAQKLLLRYGIARNMDATHTTSVVGKTLTFDLTNANPIRVQ